MLKRIKQFLLVATLGAFLSVVVASPAQAVVKDVTYDGSDPVVTPTDQISFLSVKYCGAYYSAVWLTQDTTIQGFLEPVSITQDATGCHYRFRLTYAPVGSIRVMLELPGEGAIGDQSIQVIGNSGTQFGFPTQVPLSIYRMPGRRCGISSSLRFFTATDAEVATERRIKSGHQVLKTKKSRSIQSVTTGIRVKPQWVEPETSLKLSKRQVAELGHGKYVLRVTWKLAAAGLPTRTFSGSTRITRKKCRQPLPA